MCFLKFEFVCCVRLVTEKGNGSCRETEKEMEMEVHLYMFFPLDNG